ncbi:MAG: RNA methyltransferase [Clostridia bacterium]|nr:RNA methyltransferase [Clostridia bacterium]
MTLITSNQNPFVKHIKSLKDKKHREEKKLFLIEGIRFVEEALKEQADIKLIAVSEGLHQTKGGKEVFELAQKSLSCEMVTLSHKVFKEISDTDTPQGILAVVEIKRFKLEDILNRGGLIVILDSLQDPGNMGTIIRTADAAAASGIVLSRGCVDVYNPKVLRSTMGSIFHIPFYTPDSLPDTIMELKKYGYKVMAAHLKGDLNYFEQEIGERAAIILGNEANGISQEIAALAHSLVRIPMPGRAESLNASVAAALLIYESVRRKTML